MAEKILVENKLFKRFVPPKRGIGYVEKPFCSGKIGCFMSHEIPKVPSGLGSHENVRVYHDKKIYKLYERLHNSKGQGIDFQKRKKYKPFRPGHSKYANIPNHYVCWLCGNAGHYRHSCPKSGHTWRGVPSNVKVTVQVPPKEKV